MTTLTDSVLDTALLVSWTDTWITGSCGPDDVVRVIGERRLRFPDAELDLLPALTKLRASGVSALTLALPRPGDPAGVSGDAELVGRAALAGVAALTVGERLHVLVPDDEGWTVSIPAEAEQVAVPALGSAERELQQELVAATQTLSELDLAKNRPGAAAEVDRRSAGFARLPAALGDRALRVALTAARTLAILDAARFDDGAATTAGEVRGRADVVGPASPLDSAARSALAAAVSALAPQQVSR